MVLVILVFRTVTNGVGNCAGGSANRALVVPQDWTSYTAVIIFECVAEVEGLVFAIVLAEHAEVILHFVASSLTQCRPANQGGCVNVNRS